MKKSISKLLMVLAVTALTLFVGGCGASKNSALKLKEGILSWDAVKTATHYLVDLNDVRIECEETEVNLAALFEQEGKYTVTVSCITSDDEIEEIGSLEVEAKSTARPKIVMKKDADGKTSFAWVAAEGVSSYEYDLHDGYGNQTAESQDGKEYSVAFDGAGESVITVTAKGKSEDTVVYMNSEATYHFDGMEIFNMANLANCPFYITTDGQLLNELVVGTTLKKGNYDLEMTFYLMDPNGRSLSGNGSWGRRITDPKGNRWFCEFELEEWEGSGNTLKPANEAITYTVNSNVNKYGETTLSLYSWQANEMLVVADVRLNGKSVMSDKLVPHDADDDVQFDVSKLDSYLAVYKGNGEWYDEKHMEKHLLYIPTKLADGKYEMEISYQVMDADGKMLTGNGMWGRRICDINMKNVVWYCEYEVDTHTDGMDMPRPDTTLTSTFTVTVEDGKFPIMCHNFEKGEIIAVSAVKKISGSNAKFDIETLKNYKNVFVSDGSGGRGQSFRVETTKQERGVFELEVSYYAMDADGYMLSGNGTGGRRIVDEGSDEHWLCVTAPNEDHPDAVNTVPEPNKLVTKKMTVTLNNKGRFFLDMYDFMKDEKVVIADVKFEGTSILVK